MDTIHQAVAVRQSISAWRKQGLRIAFVPTMGNLHAGHYALIALARQHADCIVASVFVNPTQFGPQEDFERYPRTLQQDQQGLAAAGCTLLFAPRVEEVYPFGVAQGVQVIVPGISDILEGASRPGHFIGVATVVTKLFAIVMPDVAIFGQKDFQQLLLIRRLISDLRLPIEIVAGETVREADGLALSSRNQYLSAEQYKQAGAIYQTLQAMRDGIRDSQSYEAIENAARIRLEEAGLKSDYAVLRRADTLVAPAVGQTTGLVALIAAYLGSTRLIDNLLV